MPRDTHDFNLSTHNITLYSKGAMNYTADMHTSTVFLKESDFAEHTSDNDGGYTLDGGITVILDKLVPASNPAGGMHNDERGAVDGASLSAFQFKTTSGGLYTEAVTLTPEEASFFGVPTLYAKGNYNGGLIYSQGIYCGWFGSPPTQEVSGDFCSINEGQEDAQTTPTAYLLLDTPVATRFTGLNRRKCADLTDLRDAIVEAVRAVDSSYISTLTYTTEKTAKELSDLTSHMAETEMSQAMAYGTFYDFFDDTFFTWDEIDCIALGFSAPTAVREAAYHAVLGYIMDNWEDEALTPNYYDYNYRKGDEWQYTAELDKSTKRVTFTLNKLTSGINMDGVGAADAFTSTAVTLKATHRVYIENDGNKRMLATINEDNNPATATKKASLYELVSNTEAYKSYAKNTDSTDYTAVEFINHLYVESEIELTVNGTQTKYTYISGLSGQNATPISYAYAVPIDDSDTFSGDNVLLNNSGHCGNNFEFRSALYAAKDLVSGDNKESIQELINAMNAIAAHSADGATFAKETLTINYNGTEGKAPEDDTASLDVGCGGVMYRLGGLLDITNLNRQLWAGANVDWNNLLCLFDNPLDAIYSLMSFPCDFEHSQSAEDVYVGNMLLANTSEMTAYRVTTRHAKIEFDFYPHGYYENFLDYAPYTGIQLHVPYYGLVDLPVDKVLDHDCKLIYYVDCNTGMARVQVKVYWKNSSTGSTKTGRSVVWESDVKISVDIPLNSTNFNEKIAAMITGAGATAMTGIGSLIPNTTMTIGNTAANAVSCLQNAVNFNNNTSKSGSFGSSTSMLADRSVYLIYSRPIWSNNAQFNHDFGRKLNDRRSLGSVSGFTKTYNVDTSSIPATKAEQDMIKSYLDSGVYL